MLSVGGRYSWVLKSGMMYSDPGDRSVYRRGRMGTIPYVSPKPEPFSNPLSSSSTRPPNAGRWNP